jgi:hypothetical protein
MDYITARGPHGIAQRMPLAAKEIQHLRPWAASWTDVYADSLPIDPARVHYFTGKGEKHDLVSPIV